MRGATLRARCRTRAAQNAFRESRKLNKVPSSCHLARPLHSLAIVSFFYRPHASRVPSRFFILLPPLSSDKFAERDSSPSFMHGGKDKAIKERNIYSLRVSHELSLFLLPRRCGINFSSIHDWKRLVFHIYIIIVIT